MRQKILNQRPSSPIKIKEPMPDTTQKSYRKPGANRNELAHKPRRIDPNFAQSRDLREDRTQRQYKTSHSTTNRSANH